MTYLSLLMTQVFFCIGHLIKMGVNQLDHYVFPEHLQVLIILITCQPAN